MLNRLSKFRFSESIFPFRPFQDACLLTRIGVYNLSLLYPVLKRLRINKNIWQYTFGHLYSKQSDSIIYVHEQNQHEFDRDKQSKIILRKLENVKELQFSIDSILSKSLRTSIQQKYYQLQDQINKLKQKDQELNEFLQRLEIEQPFDGDVQAFINNLYKSTAQNWQFNKDQISEYSNFIFRLNKIIEKSQKLGVKLVIDTEGVLPLQIYFQQFDVTLIVKQISQIRELLSVTGKADILFHESHSLIDKQSELFSERRHQQLKELVLLAQTQNLNLSVFNPDELASRVLNDYQFKFIEGLNEHLQNQNVKKASLDGYALDYLNQLSFNVGLQNKLILDELYYRSVFNS